ncbi:MAG: lamin tail domain-containing protein, partial [Candidatus Bipolaricaulis sp.]|nr:lamin tail domain-containing protein [Candidatus Bipolaricaulis sp.]
SEAVPLAQSPAYPIAKTASAVDTAGNGIIDRAGEIVGYTIAVTNTGNQSLTGVLVSDPLLGALSGPTGDLGTTGVLDVGETWTYTGSYTVQQNDLDTNGGGDGDIDNMATVSSNELPDESDSEAVLIANADLGVVKEIDDATPGEGQTIVYTIVVTNHGPSDATDAVLRDILPTGLLYAADDGAGAYSTSTNLWTIGALAVGESRTLHITATVAVGTLGWTIVNTAEITVSLPFDPNDGNNRDTAELKVIAADLSVDKSASKTTLTEGEEFVYTITVTNLGPDIATGVELTDILPLGITYVSDDGLGTYDRNSGVWIVGSLVVQASATLHITAFPSDGTVGLTVTNEAEVTRSDQYDPDDSNNRDSVDVGVVEEPEPPAGGGGSADACTGKVIINEIAWAGTAADPTNEWIELRNVGSAPVDLTDWVLRWRRKSPTEPADYDWKTVALSGTLEAAGTSACALTSVEPGSSLRFVKRDGDDYTWLVIALPQDDDGSYLMLERLSDKTVPNVDADVIYDSVTPYTMELPDGGAVVELVDATGTVMDTANAFRSVDGRWPAGDSVTFGTMERTDPLGPDAAENWHTNIGILTYGLDANGAPLAATSAKGNSQAIELLSSFVRLAPVSIHNGRSVEVSLDLTSRERRKFGWPWISVTRPSDGDVAGGGGVVSESPSTYSFSTRSVGGVCWLTIDTAGLKPGEHLIWVVYGEGKAILIPVTIVP